MVINARKDKRVNVKELLLWKIEFDNRNLSSLI